MGLLSSLGAPAPGVASLRASRHTEWVSPTAPHQRAGVTLRKSHLYPSGAHSLCRLQSCNTSLRIAVRPSGQEPAAHNPHSFDEWNAFMRHSPRAETQPVTAEHSEFRSPHPRPELETEIWPSQPHFVTWRHESSQILSISWGGSTCAHEFVLGSPSSVGMRDGAGCFRLKPRIYSALFTLEHLPWHLKSQNM